MKYLIWDFNGTIIDDVDICIESENETIKKYLDRKPLTKEEYLNIFTFPVKDYYARVGFDWNKVSYEEVGDYWFKQYQSREDKVKVYDGVVDLLKKAHSKNIKNVIISASKTEELVKQLKQFNIYEYFDEIYGADSIYAYGKSETGKAFIEGKDPSECLYIGDSLHDLDTANKMGVKCILIARGHQSKEVLLTKTKDVVDDIREVQI